MDFKPIIVLGAGILLGALGILPESLTARLDLLVKGVLLLLFLCIGTDMGRDRNLWKGIRSLGRRAIIIPALALAGSLAGGAVAAFLGHIPPASALASAAGCGYYSLTTVLLKELGGPEAMTLGLLTNLLRELAVILAMPLLVRLFGESGGIGTAGATAMDTALPFILKSTDRNVAIFSFASGAVLTLIVPFAVPLVYRMLV